MSKKDKKKENLTALENTETEVEVVETAEEQPSKEQVKADKAESKKTQKNKNETHLHSIRNVQ